MPGLHLAPWKRGYFHWMWGLDAARLDLLGTPPLPTPAAALQLERVQLTVQHSGKQLRTEEGFVKKEQRGVTIMTQWKRI